jgi:hypothetical protein
LCFPLLLLIVKAASAAEDTSRVKKNTEILTTLLENITKDIIGRSSIASGESLVVQFQPMEEGWLIQSAVLKSLQQSGYVIRSGNTAEGSSWLVEIGGPELATQYTDLHRDGFLGTKKVTRNISAKLDCRILDKRSAVYKLNDSFSQSFSDTVKIDDIDALQSDGGTSPRGTVPSGDVLDRIVEPFIIIGATGIAIYLLFNIRSS